MLEKIRQENEVNSYIERDANIQGANLGIKVPPPAAGETLIEDSVLRNKTNISKGFMYAVYGGDNLGPELTMIRNVRFNPFEQEPMQALEMAYTEPWRGPSYMQRDEIYVEDFDQVPGDNFRVY